MTPKIKFKVGYRVHSPSLEGLNPGVIIAVNDTGVIMQWLGPKSSLKGDLSITYKYHEIISAFEFGNWSFITIRPNQIWKELNET